MIEKKEDMIYQNFLTQTLQGAAKIASEMFGKTTNRQKSDTSVVTEADLKIGKFLISEIQKNYPSYNIIDEETGVIDRGSEYTWVIDPIDGTINFADGIPLYGIMMGLLKGDEPYAGGIILPFFNEIYTAEKGQGTYRNGQKVEIIDRKDFSMVSVAFGIARFGSNIQEMEKQARWMARIAQEFYTVRNSGSVYDLAAVLRGSAGANLYNGAKIWDILPEHILVTEAGGVSTDLEGKAFDFSECLRKAAEKHHYTSCSGAPRVHKKIQEIIHKNGPPPPRG